MLQGSTQGIPGQHLGSNALDSVVLLSSFIPTTFAIFALGMRDQGQAFKDKNGLTGAFSGLIILGYSMFYLYGVSSKAPDVCKVLLFSRLGLGLIFAICGGAVAFVGGKAGVPAAIAMFVFAALSFPEAYLLHEYRLALGRDLAAQTAPQMQQMAQLNPPMSQQMAPPMSQQMGHLQPPPSQGGAPPMGFGGPPQGGYGGPPQGGYGYDGPPQMGGPPPMGGYGAPPMRY
mmetsp:Transcript_14127/g.24871  ORF Transcript_14127/g.24871 Transcript_14127/m.24871 type:complete len:230 (+) Transcript_14127:150-839(+)